MPSSGLAKARQNVKTNRITSARLAVINAMRRIAEHEGRLREGHLPLIADVVAPASISASPTGTLSAGGGPVLAQLCVPSGSSTNPLLGDQQEFQALAEALHDDEGVDALDEALHGSTSAWEGMELLVESWIATAPATADTRSSATVADADAEADAEAAPASLRRGGSLRGLHMSAVRRGMPSSLDQAGVMAPVAQSSEDSGTETSASSASDTDSDADDHPGMAAKSRGRAEAATHAMRCLVRTLEGSSAPLRFDAPQLDPRHRATLVRLGREWLHVYAGRTHAALPSVVGSARDGHADGLMHDARERVVGDEHEDVGKRGGRFGLVSRVFERVRCTASAWHCLLLLLGRAHPVGAGDALADYTHAEAALARCYMVSQVGKSNCEGLCSVPSVYILSGHDLSNLANASNVKVTRTQIILATTFYAARPIVLRSTLVISCPYSLLTSDHRVRLCGQAARPGTRQPSPPGKPLKVQCHQQIPSFTSLPPTTLHPHPPEGDD